jgi:hypothetical protein
MPPYNVAAATVMQTGLRPPATGVARGVEPTDRTELVMDSDTNLRGFIETVLRQVFALFTAYTLRFNCLTTPFIRGVTFGIPGF